MREKVFKMCENSILIIALLLACPFHLRLIARITSILASRLPSYYNMCFPGVQSFKCR